MYHPGVPILNLSKRTTIRYTKQSTLSQMRSHSETLLISQQIVANNSDKSSIKGVIGQSALFMFDHIDIIKAVPTDYMHNVLLDVMKDLVEIWLGKKRIPKPPYEHFKIKTVAERKILEQRILNLKPHVTFNWKPRSIFEIANFKATEIQHLMFYYLRFALVGLLPTRIVKNFEKLSAAIYVLCKSKITSDEISSASEMLIEFSNEFEEIYGPGAVTMQIHLLTHYRQVVENCGPLWSYSMFGFEANIARLKNYVSGTTDALNQIAHKYSISREFEEANNVCENGFYQQSTICIKAEHFDALISERILSQHLNIWRRARIKGQIFTSTHAKPTKSIDFFVKMKNNRIGKIEYFFEKDSISKLLLNVY